MIWQEMSEWVLDVYRPLLITSQMTLIILEEINTKNKIGEDGKVEINVT
jgi:hypothetical protein